MDYYIGNQATTSELLGGTPRYFYGLRRTDEGDLYFARIDQLQKTDELTINNPGEPEEDYDNFEVGTDFFEGRDVNHNILYDNLNYEQYRWDGRSLYYYLNENGELMVSIGQAHTYPAPENA